jgi:MraZ protein
MRLKNPTILQQTQSNMLIGEYTHTQDDKKRISLPSKFRKEIGKKVVITHGLDNCLFMFPVKEWMKISEKLGGLSMGQADSRGFNRIMLAGAVEVDVDAIGRILIPEFLREYAGVALKTKVVFAGVHSRVEVWDESRWKEYKAKILKQADQLAEKLGEVGVI